VAAIAAPGVTLAPAKGPAPTISDSKLSGERERAAEPGASVESKLDTGAGPAGSETRIELVKPAAAAESPLAAAKPESAAPSAPGTGGGAMYAAAEGSTTAAGGGPVIPSQKFKSNPPAEAAVDSLEREPAVGGRHYLSTDAISMMTGTSRVYDFVAPIRRVSIADSKIADIQVINPHQLMLVGHDPGFTTLVVWDGQGHYEERQVRIEKEGHQQVVLNVVVAEINRSKLEQQGIDAEVLDLRVLRPLDTLAILASVRKCRRAVVIDEAWRTGSLAAEVMARIAENAFYDLDAPLARVCSEEVPMPYARHLEEAALPQPEKIVAAARSLLGKAP